MINRVAILLLLAGITTASLTSAQEDCPALTQPALESALEACQGIEASTICYGAGELEVEPKSGVSGLRPLSKAGDVMDAAQVNKLSLTRDANLSVAVILSRANLPENTLTIIAFGDVQLHNASDNTSDFMALESTVAAREGANVRAAPSADAPLVTQLATGQAVLAIGRSADSSWIRLLDGWTAAALLSTQYDWSLLAVVPRDIKFPKDDLPVEDQLYAPMQAVNFRAELDDAPCSAETDSGLLMQSPAEDTELKIKVNGIEVTFQGTLYLQAPRTGETFISVLEGTLRYGDIRYRAGQRIEWSANGALAASEDYAYVRAVHLPLALLPRAVELPFSLGGLVAPFVPGTGSVANVQRNDPCVVAWVTDVNLRSGPGTQYRIRQGVAANHIAHPDAYATGLDGTIWWRLAEGIWIQSGVVSALGACIELPVVPPPPLPETGG